MFSVADECNAEAVANVSTDGPTNNGCSYSQTWTATYSGICEDAASVSITYHWIEADKPVISTDAVDNSDLGCNPETIDAPMFSVADECNAEAVANVSTDGPTNNGCSYSQTWTATYSGICEDAASVSITYHWIEADKPVISTDAVDNSDLGCNPETIDAPMFSVADECNAEAVANVSTDGPTNNGCSYSQTWTATYSGICEDAASVSITYHWIEADKPVISTDAVDNSDLGCNPETIDAPMFSVADECNAEAVANVSTDGPTNNGCSYSQTWTATYSGICEDAASVSITYHWIEADKPVISTDAVDNSDLGCNPETIDAPMFSVADECNAEAVANVSTDGPTNNGCSYSQTWTATYSGICEDAASVSITYHWIEADKPVISTDAVDNSDLGCNPETIDAPMFSVADECNAEAVANVSTDGPTNNGCSYSQTWTATYSGICEDAASVSITYHWIEADKPVISTDAVDNSDLGCNPETIDAPMFSVADECNAEAVANVSTDGPTNNGCSYSQTWTATYSGICEDAASVSITYHWIEADKPVISTDAVDNSDLGCNPETIDAPMFSVADECNAEAVANVSTDGPTNNGCSYSQTWTATYSGICEDAASVSITYHWIEADKPVISTDAVDNSDLGCNPETIDAPMFSVADECNAEAVANVSTDGPTNNGCSYSQTWTATYSGICEDAASVSITYHWIEADKPVISTDAVDNSDLGCNPETIDAPMFSVADECNAEAVANVSTDGPTNNGCSYSQTWTATYSGICEDAASVSITYHWIEADKPVISTDAVDNSDLGCNPETIDAPMFSVADECNAEAVANVSTDGPTNNGCSYSQTWTATYSGICEDAASVSITYHWIEADKPVISTDAVDNSDLGCNPETIDAPMFSVADECNAEAVANVSTDGPTNNGCSYSQTWTATYSGICEDAASVSITYHWIEADKPVISTDAVDNSDLGCNPETIDAPMFSVADECNAEAVANVSTDGPTNNGCSYSQTWTATYSGICEDAASVSITYHWIEADKPVISTDAVDNSDLGCNPETIDAPMFSVADECNAEAVANVSTDGPTNNGCSYSQTWTATYSGICEDAASVSITYHWIEADKPVISTDAVDNSDLGCNPETIDAPMFSVADECNAEAVANVSTDGPTNNGCSYSQTWTATYSGICEDAASVSITYHWIEADKPVISTDAVDNSDLGCNPETIDAPMFSVADECNAEAVANVSTDGPTNNGCSYSQTWTATYSGICEDAASVSITYHWIEADKPVISTDAVDNSDLGCNPETIDAPMFSVADECNAEAVANVSTDGPTNNGCSYSQTWTATYSGICEDAASVSITYHWIEADKPVISTDAVDNSDLGCNPETIDAPMFSVADECNAEAVANVSTDGPTNNGCSYSQTWTATYSGICEDAASVSITYHWIEADKPVISTDAVDNSDLGCNPETIDAPMFSVADECNAEAVANVSTDGPTNNGCSYSQTWTATYSGICEDAASVSITYHWIEADKPVISTDAVDNSDLGCNPETIDAPMFSVADECNAEAVANVSTDGPTNNGCSYSQTWTATYSGICEDAASVSITYHWIEADKPVISTDAVDNSDLGCNPETIDAPMFSVADECNAEAVANVSTDGPTNNGCSYSQTWTATYSGICEDAASVSITYHWIEADKPVISTDAVDNSDLGCNPETIDAPMFSVADECNAEAVANVSTDGPTNNGCSYSQTWTATYSGICEDAASVSITYHWIEADKPVISTDAVDNSDLGCNPETIDAPMFSVADECNAEAVANVSTDGPTNNGCSYSQTWTATYSGICEDAASVSITYHWIEADKPVISTDAVDNSDLGCNPETIDAPMFSVADECNAEAVANVSTDGPTNNGCSYSQTWTATYSGICEDAASVSITYHWIEADKPVISTDAVDNSDLGCNPETHWRIYSLRVTS